MILTQDMMRRCHGDGGSENLEGYCEQRRPLVKEIPKLDLPKRLPADDLYEPGMDAVEGLDSGKDQRQLNSEPVKKRLIRCQALTAMSSCRRIHKVTAKGASGQEL